MQIDFPFHVDARHRTAQADGERHVRALIEQVLFTGVGERVNRPSFGTNLLQLVFAPVGEELVTAVQQLVSGALLDVLGELILVEDVATATDDGTLTVTVSYILRRTGRRDVARFTRAV
jgi:phage baseplate assembly protein W